MFVIFVSLLSTVVLAAPQGYNYNHQVSSSGAGFLTVQQPGSSSLNYFGRNNQQIVQNPTSLTTSSSSNTYQTHQSQKQDPIISKRFFIHSAPEENDEEYREKHITVGTPRKNYNVLFIKAPSKSAKKTVLKITPAINEEKTVVYVLSKKTDGTDIQTEVLEPQTSTSKPEVYFIKYKTPEEAANAQEQIQFQYDALGGSTQVTDEGLAPVTSVIGSLSSNSDENQGQQTVGFGKNPYLPPQY